MKKVVTMLLCMTVCGAALFAQDGGRSLFSVGGGLALMPGFKLETVRGYGEQNSSEFGAGINVFFDAKYAEANIDLIFANAKGKDSDKGMDSTNLLIGIVGKYPISLAERFAFFPYVGIDYRIALGGSYEGTKIDKPGDQFNAMSLLFGLGVDYDITNALYFRGEVGLGVTFNTKKEEDTKDFTDNFKIKIPIKLAVGYRL
ncbi:MAG: porin family protein [Spirochaetaceae bacterium]|nr:porin family protein [Spirochaetaceae bacterium]